MASLTLELRNFLVGFLIFITAIKLIMEVKILTIIIIAFKVVMPIKARVVNATEEEPLMRYLLVLEDLANSLTMLSFVSYSLDNLRLIS